MKAIVTLCGSTKFKQTWIAENARLTQEGNIVLSVGLWGHHERVFPDAETKARLDTLHLRKIDLCHWVWVLDVGGYIGESTWTEISYAEAHDKPVRYLSKEFPDYIEPVDSVQAELKTLQERLAGQPILHGLFIGMGPGFPGDVPLKITKRADSPLLLDMKERADAIGKGMVIRPFRIWFDPEGELPCPPGWWQDTFLDDPVLYAAARAKMSAQEVIALQYKSRKEAVEYTLRLLREQASLIVTKKEP